jgi:hypothetical protein
VALASVLKIKLLSRPGPYLHFIVNRASHNYFATLLLESTPRAAPDSIIMSRFLAKLFRILSTTKKKKQLALSLSRENLKKNQPFFYIDKILI